MYKTCLHLALELLGRSKGNLPEVCLLRKTPEKRRKHITLVYRATPPNMLLASETN